uniref:PHD-type domain-containing protein n=2 Tax=Leptocylindrus danicus TaxID=163516 RepID=A0A7S2K1U8_9STRA
MGSKDKLLRAPADAEGFCCPWGCSVASNNDEFQREILSFPTRRALDDHIDKYHIHRDDSDCGKNSTWIRIPEGGFIQSMCADITSACCAMNMDLMRVATEFKGEESCIDTEAESGFSRSPFPVRMIFKYDALLDLTEGGRGSLHFSNILFALASTDVSMRRLLRLWSRLARLFAVESDGKFRLSNSKYLTRVGNSAPSKSPFKDTEVADIVVVDDGEGKADESMDSVVSAEELLDDTYFREEEVHGDVQYELMSDAYFPEDRYKGPTILSHKMDVLKDLLLRLASRVPTDLKTQLSLWDKPYFQRWATFVKNGRNGRMLMQALILLQNGVKQFLLPKWWNRGRGWCSSFGALSGVTSISNFALRLFVLDAAIAEYIKTHQVHKADASEATDTDEEAAAVDNGAKPARGTRRKGKEKSEEAEKEENTKEAVCTPAPSGPFELLRVEDMVVHLESRDLDASYSRLMKMKFKDRMKAVSDIATKLFIRRFEGLSGDLCRACGSGGDLLCCEYCNQVQHMECCNPPLHSMPDYDFICDDCVKDINVSDVYAKKFPKD